MFILLRAVSAAIDVLLWVPYLVWTVLSYRSQALGPGMGSHVLFDRLDRPNDLYIDQGIDRFLAVD